MDLFDFFCMKLVSQKSDEAQIKKKIGLNFGK